MKSIAAGPLRSGYVQGLLGKLTAMAQGPAAHRHRDEFAEAGLPLIADWEGSSLSGRPKTPNDSKVTQKCPGGGGFSPKVTQK